MFVYNIGDVLSVALLVIGIAMMLLCIAGQFIRRLGEKIINKVTHMNDERTERSE